MSRGFFFAFAEREFRVEPSASLPLFLKAAGFGLAVAAPVGPMSLLCMRRCLGQGEGQGWQAGLATGAGIALGDACYALVAALGLSGLSGFLLAREKPLHLAAGLFLLYLGLRSWRRRPAETGTGTTPEAVRLRPWPALASALLLTLTNPPTILMFAAIFTALAPRGGFDTATAVLTVLGVFAGSMLWWCGLVAALTRLRHLLTPRARLWIDRLAGLVLAGFGLATLRRGF
ncbi:LysE family translocator [Roseomonas gilardii subsp. gilardii]|uniref:LysE family translocator n=1 Tax=Roseomonas gilardii TaxID=257708 RepID=UPI001FFA839E|nr:LysE family translocator [Roseomonas gilardii]UPG72748.1 LysE family translocator [Roseomonas gilardii subsp. gilardii]